MGAHCPQPHRSRGHVLVLLPSRAGDPHLVEKVHHHPSNRPVHRRPGLRVLLLVHVLFRAVLRLVALGWVVRGRGVRGLRRHGHPHVVSCLVHRILYLHVPQARAQGKGPRDECTGRDEGRAGARRQADPATAFGWRQRYEVSQWVGGGSNRLAGERDGDDAGEGDAVAEGVERARSSGFRAGYRAGEVGEGWILGRIREGVCAGGGGRGESEGAGDGGWREDTGRV